MAGNDLDKHRCSSTEPTGSSAPSVDRLPKRGAYFTYDPKHGGAYYFAPTDRSPPPYLMQRSVEAILDIAADGTLAGVELVWGKLPPPPASSPTERVELGERSNTEMSFDPNSSEGSRTTEEGT